VSCTPHHSVTVHYKIHTSNSVSCTPHHSVTVHYKIHTSDTNTPRLAKLCRQFQQVLTSFKVKNNILTTNFIFYIIIASDKIRNILKFYSFWAMTSNLHSNLMMAILAETFSSTKKKQVNSECVWKWLRIIIKSLVQGLYTPTNIVGKQFADCRQTLFLVQTSQFKTSCRVDGICAGCYISAKWMATTKTVVD
jgi:hypothetical protein